MPDLRPLHLPGWLRARRCWLLRGHLPEASMVSELGRRVSCSDCDASWSTWYGAYFDARRYWLRRIVRAYQRRGQQLPPTLFYIALMRGLI